jgi:hypothetical protein
LYEFEWLAYAGYVALSHSDTAAMSNLEKSIMMEYFYNIGWFQKLMAIEFII